MSGPTEDALAKLGAAMLAAPFRQYASTFIQIEDESGELVPFIFNEAQEVVEAARLRQVDAGVAVRLLILKGRQQGMSTYCQAYIAWRCLTREGTRAHTVAHNLALTHDLYDKLERAWRQLPTPESLGGIKVRPNLASGGERGRRLVFEDPMRSRARYDSAHDPEGVGRGGTVHIMHLTEVPQWSKPEATMQAILASISNHPDTCVFVETTAKGASGWFYEQWLEAMRLLDRGEEPEFYPVFVAWFLTKRYRRKRRTGESPLTKREKAERDQYGLDNEQMYWYRDQRDRYGDRVAEEYPYTWQEAFLHSGLPFFRPETVRECMKKTRKPLKQGRFRPQKGKDSFKFVSDGEGPLCVYELPDLEARYTVGVDFASGRAADRSAIVVLNVDTTTVAAVYRDDPRAKALPDDVLIEAMLLGRMYNMAHMVPERTGIGQTLVDRLVRDYNYPDVYREADTVAVRPKGGRRFGFATSASSRPWLLEETAHLVHIDQLQIPDVRIVREMETFVFTDDEGKKAEAGDGAHDDLVFALALAVRGMSTCVLPASVRRNHTHRPVVSSTTGY